MQVRGSRHLLAATAVSIDVALDCGISPVGISSLSTDS